MGTKTIGISEEVYERLRARKRADESFTETLDRLLDESIPEWREGFGALDDSEASELEELVADSRQATGRGLAERQTRASDDVDDETA